MASGKLPPSPSSTYSSWSSRPRKKLVTNACDPCKIRKIKCSGISPCRGCEASNIDCTFNRVPSTRGPRRLRAKTINRIAESRRGDEYKDVGETDELSAADVNETHLGEVLAVYATRLFPIWPIVDAPELSASLITQPQGGRAHHLANAVALATVAQLKLTTPWQASVDQVEQAAQDVSRDLLDSLRVSFFLHIYYENQTAGGTKSLLYLREAITKAQLLRIDREATYTSLRETEQQLLRRVLWLLFVTERGVAMLHKLPVVLRPNIIFPWADRVDDRAHVLPAFLKLVHLFWVFDQSGIFDILRNADADISSMESLARGCLELLQTKLQDVAEDGFLDLGAGEEHVGNDVQRADMVVTRQWMRAVLWRAALRFGVVVPVMNPVDVAGEFLSLVAQLPIAALESQGPTLEFKTYEIATAVVDAVTESYPMTTVRHQPKDVLAGLHRILSSSRGGNKRLLSLLNAKLAAANPDLRILAQPSSPVTLVGNDASIEHGMSEQQYSWGGLDITAGIEPYVDGSDYQSLEQQVAQMSWPPLGLSHMMRSPSPLTWILLENLPPQQMLTG